MKLPFMIMLATLSLSIVSQAQSAEPATAPATQTEVLLTETLEISLPDLAIAPELLVVELPPELETQTCASNKGLTLTVPSISGGKASAGLVMNRNGRVLIEAPPELITGVKTADGQFSMIAKNEAGKSVLKISGRRDQFNRYNITARWAGLGLVGFRCN